MTLRIITCIEYLPFAHLDWLPPFPTLLSILGVWTTWIRNQWDPMPSSFWLDSANGKLQLKTGKRKLSLVGQQWFSLCPRGFGCLLLSRYHLHKMFLFLGPVSSSSPYPSKSKDGVTALLLQAPRDSPIFCASLIPSPTFINNSLNFS